MKRLVCLLLISAFLINCGNEDTEPIDIPDAPSIPPAASFIMDFTVTNPSSGRQMTNTNWTIAALNVGLWNAIITVNLVVPVASFVNSVNRTPTFDASLPGWVWEYDFEVFGVAHRAKLIGKVTTSEVQWEMLISRDGFYDDFSWYTGTSSLTGTSGTWTLNRDTDNPEPYVFIEWNRSLDGTTGDIKYTNIVPNVAQNGGFIFQEATTGVDFDRFYEIFYAESNGTVTIQWNSQNENGQIKDPVRFGNEDFRCWDENQEDVDCPS